ncbi:hypothetical protein [Azospirillum brasilense]|uniref:Uncharacterized protein n=1 Tax=Azospirillum brasilense TaxID=192 RepID=A0A235HBP4_AZOBR|nr:hypothetical protein [Azospirillum brasilense]OYD82937.1 hypothetical protein CHT98_17475 [Azospirillum brasilense]
MTRQDAFGPFIEHLGALTSAVANPVTGLAIAVLAVLIVRRQRLLLAAVAVGTAEGALMTLLGVAHVGVVAACTTGAAGSVLQALLIWPFAHTVRRLSRRILRPPEA